MSNPELAAHWWRTKSNSPVAEEMALAIEELAAGGIPSIGHQRAQLAQTKGERKARYQKLELPDAKQEKPKNTSKKKKHCS